MIHSGFLKLTNERYEDLRMKRNWEYGILGLILMSSQAQAGPLPDDLKLKDLPADTVLVISQEIPLNGNVYQDFQDEHGTTCTVVLKSKSPQNNPSPIQVGDELPVLSKRPAIVRRPEGMLPMKEMILEIIHPTIESIACRKIDFLTWRDPHSIFVGDLKNALHSTVEVFSESAVEAEAQTPRDDSCSENSCAVR